MTKKTKTIEKKYKIEVNEQQLFILENACENYARMLAGQDMIFQDLFEEAWHKNVQKKQNLEYTGDEFWDMRKKVEGYVRELKELCWNQPVGTCYGVNYSEKSDILFDMYQTFRYQRYLDMSKEEQDIMQCTVMADSPGHYADVPLPIVEKVK